MKTIKPVIAAGLLAGRTSLSFAGPGPQFWARQTKNAGERQAQAVVPAKVEAPTAVASCVTCSCCAKKS